MHSTIVLITDRVSFTHGDLLQWAKKSCEGN